MENIDEKMEIMFHLLRQNDSVSESIIRISKIKLPEGIYRRAIAEGKINQSHFKKAKELGAVSKGKKLSPGRGSRFDGTEIEEMGKNFEKELKLFLDERKIILNTIREKTGYEFQPFWRNLLNVGKGKKKTESSEIIEKENN